MRLKTWRTLAALLVAGTVSLAGCEGGDSTRPDIGADGDLVVLLDAEPDAAPVDMMVADAAPPDAALVDLAIPDGEPPPLEDLSLNSLVPNRGEVGGGYEVRVIGAGFTEGLIVAIGGQDCLALTIEGPNHARCTVPNGVPGPATVSLTRPSDGQRVEAEEAFTYYQPVEITALRPARAPLRGGVAVRIEGTGLIDGSRVTIGERRADNVVAAEDGSLSVVVPAGEPGPADVEVVNFNGQHTLSGGLFYYEEISIDAIDPPVGPVDGGLRAELRGQGLTRDSRVFFGERGAEVQSADERRTRLEIAVPRGAGPGAVDVTVENDNGSLVVPSGFVYYDPAAVGFSVAGIAPASGPVEGGNTVFVAGSGFTATTEVTFGGRAVACETLDAFRLSCTAPPGDVATVDVQISDAATGGNALLADGYTWFQTLEIITIIPDRGAVAGGARVTVTGRGFVPDLAVELGEVELEDVQVIDETRLVGTTPANTAGPVDVRASTPFSRSTIPSGFTYFDPTSDFGGVWGEPIDGAVNITVINGASGQPEPEAAVIVTGADEALRLEGLSNAAGQVTLSDPALAAPVNVTAAKEGFEATTIEDVEAENVTILLQPNDGEGSPPPGVPAAILQGSASGLDIIPKPMQESLVNIMVIETTHSTPYNRSRLPPPGPGGILLEDGPFEIIARPGELAIVATVGEIPRDTLKDYNDGLLDYWTMRQSLRPLSMGIRRFISASPGDTIADLEVQVDHPMDLIFPIDFDNPPLGFDPGPEYYAVLPRLNFGAEGFWEIDAQGFAFDPAITMTTMPRLAGWPGDLTYYLIGIAFSNTADQTPQAITIAETRNVEAGVFITPFVGAPFIIDPGPDGILGPERRVTWGVADGFDGPIRVPSANLISIEEPGLGGPKPLWRYITPSLVTEFVVPELPAEAGATGLGGGAMILTVIPFISEGPFDFDNFTYNDLNRWEAWGVHSTIFVP